MEPENIDKLFKDKMAGFSPSPSPDAWLRLQQKMEPPKKERTMWVYYAAASIALLLISGSLLFKNYYALPGNNNVPVAISKPAQKNNNLPVPEATQTPALASTSETTNETLNEKNQKERIVDLPNPAEKFKTATMANKPSVKQVASINTPKKLPLAKVKNSDDVMPELETEATPTLAQNSQTSSPVNNTVALTPTPPALGVVQVVIKRDNTDDALVMNSEQTDLKENIARKGALLKNIYKQARNLKNGEAVELAALGIDTEKVNSESKNLKQKITKVISL